jgi:maltose/moltooligosaccharide transporter
MEKPRQSFWGLWNISFGFFGIQMAWALQNANVSRIFQTLGSSVEDLPILWLAGPVTGLLVQPLIGHYSDRTWGRFGRRRPFFVAGALLAAAALFGLPNASMLLAAAVFLWLLDASLNISMEPFRAFVGDMVPASQRATGYAFQTAFIGAGSVLGSLFPILLNALGVANTAAAGVIPPSVRYSFYIGIAAICLAVLWTVITTKEYAPEEMRRFDPQADAAMYEKNTKLNAPKNGLTWILIGGVLLAIVQHWQLDKQLYVLGGGLAAFGLAQMFNRWRAKSGASANALSYILSDLVQMPEAMKRLALVQFFTWIALFIMWINTTPIVTQYIYHSTDTTSAAFNAGADWVGVLFSVYNGVAALAAFMLPALTRKFGASKTHLLCLLCGAASYAAILFIRDKNLLLLPMIGIGIAWASILTMPYVILSSVLPQQKLGIYMGIFNFFIVLPQLIIATVMGGIMKTFFPGEPIWTMLVAAIVMGLAALAMLRVDDTQANTLP